MKYFIEEISQPVRQAHTGHYEIEMGYKILLTTKGSFNNEPDKKSIKQMIKLLRVNLDAGIIDVIRTGPSK